MLGGKYYGVSSTSSGTTKASEFEFSK